jgi:hypothetical protein
MVWESARRHQDSKRKFFLLLSYHFDVADKHNIKFDYMAHPMAKKPLINNSKVV